MCKLCLAFFLTVASSFGLGCAGLASLQFPATSALVVHEEAGSKFVPPGEKAPIAGLPDFCRVETTLSPTSDSDIKIEVWLPLAGWNGKFQGVGNGGFAGSLNLSRGSGLAAALLRGYATATTDTGHVAGGTDAAWALGHPEKVTDWGHRAIHLMTERAKAIVEAFYGRKATYSYFSSCSNGGRQALMEVQRYPGDYDGVIAGAPANQFTLLMSEFAWNQQALARNPIPSEQLKVIETAVLKECDASDGLADGVIDRPNRCRPEAMLKSLPKGEAETMRKIYGGLTGKFSYEGFPPGAETGPGGWGGWITSPKSAQGAFATDFFRYIVFGNAAYDLQRFDVNRDVPIVEAKLGGVINAVDAKPEKFAVRGGKLILYHGWNDPAIPAPATIRYYEQLRNEMGAKSADRFTRLYLVPGMQHCGGGPGVNSFGAYGEGSAEMFSALERWVEKGEAPKEIIGKNISDQHTRPLCPYPEVAKYLGEGDPNTAAAFKCMVRK